MPQTIIKAFDVTIPAGTLPTAPLVTRIVMPPRIVDHIAWTFPSGCNGLVGIQIGARAVPILPNDIAQFFIRSGETSGYDLEDMHDSGDWSVIGYNTGSFPHTIHVTFKLRVIPPKVVIPGYLTLDVVDTLQGGG